MEGLRIGSVLCWSVAASPHPLGLGRGDIQDEFPGNAGGACDVGGQGDPDTQPVVSCYYDDNTQGPGEVCDNVEGPFCMPGFHCVPK